MSRNMKIYTKTGDEGSTSLFGGERVLKDHEQVQVYGAIDELNSVLGLVLAESELNLELRSDLVMTQSLLFVAGSEVATPCSKTPPGGLVSEKEIQYLETRMDAMDQNLEPLKNFIMPGGNRASASLHLARTVCRRVERLMITLNRSNPCRKELLVYFNRLSDFLFVAARFENRDKKIEDTLWRG